MPPPAPKPKRPPKAQPKQDPSVKALGYWVPGYVG